jgi:hypothetical protein
VDALNPEGAAMFRVRNQTAVAGLLTLLIFTFGTDLASAAEAPKPDAPPSLFREVIPAPTGKNGYEELVMAADALGSSAQYRKAEQLAGESDLTLAMKRYVLLDPPVVRALALLKRGLAKPVSAPRPAGAAATVPPELSHFRRLARLLAMQQYVLLADGRVPEAIGNARLGLQLGQAVKTDSLLTGLVGVAISTVCIHSSCSMRSARNGCASQIRPSASWKVSAWS